MRYVVASSIAQIGDALRIYRKNEVHRIGEAKGKNKQQINNEHGRNK